MTDWPMGLSTGCFYHTSILECLEDIRNAGFNTIEICSSPTHLDYRDIEAVRRAVHRIEELEIDAYSLHAPFASHIDITAFDPRVRQHALEEILLAAEAAAALGVQYLVIHPGPETGGFPEQERLQRMENAVGVLNQVSRRCGELGIGFVLENMLPHLFFGRTRDILWMLGAMDTMNVGICLDTGHAHLSGDLRTVVHKLSGHLWMVHASDNFGTYDDHLAPGQGTISWEPLLAQLDRLSFSGLLILEIAAVGEMSTTLQTARSGFKYLRTVARRLALDAHRNADHHADEPPS